MMFSTGTWPLPSMLLIVSAAVVGLAVGWWTRRAVNRYRPAATDGAGAAAPARVPPLVLEILTAVLFVVLAWRFGLSWQLPAYLFFAAIGVELSAIDLRHRLLPNLILLRAVVLGTVLLIVPAAVEVQWGSLLRAGLGAVLLFVLYLVLAIINPRGLGMGDVKLACLLGLFLAFHGWQTLLEGAFLGFLFGAAAGLLVLASRRGSRKSAFPFGPSMFAGAIVALLWT